jgi:hypothetical protein
MPNSKINTNDPNARRAEAFLNSWEEAFEPDAPQANALTFRSVFSHTQIALYFFDSYAAANEYGKAHFDPVTAKRRWNLNGSMLYVISGNDAEKVQSLASHFAGRE